jgi:hypothetical protein
MPPVHAVPGHVRSAGRFLLLAVLALVLAAVLIGCGGESPVATAAGASTASVSREQRAFDAVAKGHAEPRFLKLADQKIAKAAANPRRSELWAIAFRGAAQAAQSGDGYEANTGRATKTGRAMLRVAIGFWDRYVGLRPRPLDDGTFRRMLGAFGDEGLRDLAALRRRLEVIAPLLTDPERLTVTRVFPTLADAVSSTPRPFLTPAPTIRFHTEDGFRFALRMIGSKKLIRYPDDSVDVAPGKVFIAARLEVTNETPGRRTYLPIDASSIELGVRDTRCHHNFWKGLCSDYNLVGFGDDAGEITGQTSGGQQQLDPDVPFTFWAVSEELRDRPARDFTIDIHSYAQLTFTSPPATAGEPKGNVRRLNLDGPAIRPCGPQC